MTMLADTQIYTAFDGHRLLIRGRLDEVALELRRRTEAGVGNGILIFSDSTGKQMDVDVRGSEADVLQRLQVYLAPPAPTAHSGPGRPKLGVTTREVSLLPQHWEWLATQQGGASAVLRRLVEVARKAPDAAAAQRLGQERAYMFMNALAGDLPGYEEALRALYRYDREGFEHGIEAWPSDVRAHALRLAEGAFARE